MTIQFDLVQTVGIAAIVFFIGSYIKSKVFVFQKYFIPAPVIGGLLCSLLLFWGQRYGIFNVKFTNTLQDFFMNVFFTTVGFLCSYEVFKNSGKRGLAVAISCVVLLVVQNCVGVSLASVFGINKLLGVAMGSIAMSGGVGSGMSFGPTLEAAGAVDGTVVGVAAATFGLLLGSLTGGPVAERLIARHSLKSNITVEETTAQKIITHLSSKNFFKCVITVLFAAFIGTYINKILALTRLNFPYYVGCMFGGVLIRNIEDKTGMFKLNMEEVNVISNCSLNLFLSLALMSLNIARLVGLALPMLAILFSQAIVMMLWAYFVTFNVTGRDYDAAVMAAGHCGVGLGQQPNAVANMAAVIDRNGPAPIAWLVLPVVSNIVINVCNPFIIMSFIKFFK